MNRFSKRLPCVARLCAASGSGRSRRITLLATLPLVAGMLCLTPSARADYYTFSVSGSGITASGLLQVSNTGPFGAYTITGISGTFSDANTTANNNPFSGTITSLNYAPPPVTDPTDPTDTFFNAPAFTDSGLSYDNLFWPNGDSPAVCVDAPVFSGGDFDIYGLSFNVDGGDQHGGYTIDLWSNGPDLGGYQLNGSSSTGTFLTPQMDGLAYAEDFSAAVHPTPEPDSLLLMGSGMAGLFTLLRRRRSA